MENELQPDGKHPTITDGRGGPQQIPRPEQWRLGARPSWMDSDRARKITAEHVRSVFGGRSGEGRDAFNARRAVASILGDVEGLPPAPTSNSAVAVILNPGPAGLEVLLTQRSWHLRTHQGEIAFPGGGEESGDENLTATALREAHEEVGIDLSTVEVVGELDHLSTLSSDRKIVPVVCLVPTRPWVRADPNEVDAILHISLAELVSPEVFREERWGPEEGFPMWFFELQGETVWGATAAMLHQLLRSLLAEEERFTHASTNVRR